MAARSPFDLRKILVFYSKVKVVIYEVRDVCFDQTVLKYGIQAHGRPLTMNSKSDMGYSQMGHVSAGESALSRTKLKCSAFHCFTVVYM